MFMEVLTTRLIEFSDEQAMMQDAAKRFSADRSPIEKVRELIEAEEGYEDAVWQEAVGLGWTGIAIPEEFGGSALPVGTLVPVVEQLGRGLMSLPVVSTVLAAEVINKAGSHAQKSTYLTKLAEGGAGTLALAERDGGWGLVDPSVSATKSGDTITLSGSKALVEHANKADVIVVSATLDGETVLALLEGSDLPEGALTRETVIDETRRSFRVNLDGVSVSSDRLMPASEALAHYELAAMLFVAADGCGAADSCLATIVEYLTTRKQFDKLIGSYQGLKHPAAAILQGVEAARSHLYHAATLLDAGDKGAESAIRMAKHRADEVACFAGDRAIQFHGGFGFTYECNAQLYRRRSIWNAAQLGDPTYQRQKLADLLFG